ncbi:MAG: MBL fold metallo-hydrolase [Woeseiaceae bacterium]|nr:MBL fold metallo-hydrolase [Woeseiaceae bacterium]
MPRLRRLLVALLPALLFGACGTSPAPVSAVIETRDGPSAEELARPTQVVVLGTGTPVPDARRAGASIAVIHRGRAYLFDVGPGAVQNAIRARYRHDIPALYPSQVCCVFLTHLHSDHTLDYAELAFKLWWRRPDNLRAFGPRGLAGMTEGLYEMMRPDTLLRTTGAQPVADPGLYEVDVTEISAGTVLEEDGIRIEAFDVDHGTIKPAFGYRITTSDRTIVISGDTAYSENLVGHARGADLLFHEVISDAGLARNTPFWQNYHRQAHTPASDVGRIASEIRPGLLVLYHGLYYGVPEETVVDEVRALYDGDVVLADDLDIY